MQHRTLTLAQTIIYTLTLFLSAWLLFWVEPLVAKMLLPLLGGTPAVWNTSMMFYQCLLLGGYWYAHLITRYLNVRYQISLHIILLIVATFTLPIVIPYYFTSPNINYPLVWLLSALTLMIGAPLFLLCATAPLLQHWFSITKHPDAKDPYFLYAASNLGSMLALLAYPFFLERFLTLNQQSIRWSIFYGILILCIAFCASFLQKNNRVDRHNSQRTEKLSLKLQLYWIALAFIPSSLLLAVTTFLTTDVASIPLLWIIPLIIYLLTFILTFSHQTFLRRHFLIRLEPLLIAMVILVLFLMRQNLNFNLLSSFGIQLLGFFVISMVCNGQLAHTRPHVNKLTIFYLWIAVGGLLGGIFNALIAPAIFNDVWEYPLVLLFATFLKPPLSEKKSLFFNFIFTLIVLILSLKIIFALDIKDLTTKIEIYIFIIANALLVFFNQKPWRYGLAITLLLFFGYFIIPPKYPPLLKVRSFFGTYKITQQKQWGIHMLWHGTTLHGVQFLDPTKQKLPTTYYPPLQTIFDNISKTPRNIAVIGLGVGSTACYRRPQDQLTFFEIDPVIEKIARDTHYFTYLKLCPPTAIILGDARLTIQKEPPHSYDLIIVDAFSSDSIPMHLLTQEALIIYLTKLKPNGLLVFHISNRYLKLTPILGRLAQQLQLNIIEGQFNPNKIVREKNQESPSLWIILSRNSAILLPILEKTPNWQVIKTDPKTPLWRDDFSNIFSTL